MMLAGQICRSQSGPPRNDPKMENRRKLTMRFEIPSMSVRRLSCPRTSR